MLLEAPCVVHSAKLKCAAASVTHVALCARSELLPLVAGAHTAPAVAQRSSQLSVDGAHKSLKAHFVRSREARDRVRLHEREQAVMQGLPRITERPTGTRTPGTSRHWTSGR